jgi:hypothetical protein
VLRFEVGCCCSRRTLHRKEGAACFGLGVAEVNRAVGAPVPRNAQQTLLSCRSRHAARVHFSRARVSFTDLVRSQQIHVDARFERRGAVTQLKVCSLLRMGERGRWGYEGLNGEFGDYGIAIYIGGETNSIEGRPEISRTSQSFREQLSNGVLEE